MKKPLILLALVVLVAVGWYLLSPLFIVVELDEASPLDMDEETLAAFNAAMEEAEGDESFLSESMESTATTLNEVSFEAQAHEVEGVAQLIQDGDTTYLRFEDFETINGPDLHVYLSTDLEATDYIDLGELKATKGSFNYDVSSFDTETYNKVLVWCDPFSVLFSSADFSP